MSDARLLVYGGATLYYDHYNRFSNIFMEAVIDSYPDQSISVSNAHLFMGLNLRGMNQHEKAADHFRKAVLVPLDRQNIRIYRGIIDSAQSRAIKRLRYDFGEELANDPQISAAIHTLQRELDARTAEIIAGDGQTNGQTVENVSEVER
jgi:tetratricopeptide (TPR) repeat protein